MKKVLTILGARPQFIKAATVSEAMRKEGIAESIVHTGQHFDANMSDVFFSEMGIPRPEYNLGIHSLGHSAMTGQMMVEIEKILVSDRPDLVLVYGDTNSTLAGALASAKLNIPIAHVEAGLRSRNMLMPEEINRIITDQVSNFLFCPTPVAVENLVNEGLASRAEISLTGDVMFDSVLRFRELARHPERIPENGYVLCTIHRQESTDNVATFGEILEAIKEISTTSPVVFPVHPRTRQLIEGKELPAGVILIDPVGYLEMLSLLRSCELVITDSGGLQKEAFFNRKYCVTVRTETEWTELVEHGFNRVVGTGRDDILHAVAELLGKRIEEPPPLYGRGDAGIQIARIISGNYDERLESKPGLPDRDLRRNLGCG